MRRSAFLAAAAMALMLLAPGLVLAQGVPPGGARGPAKVGIVELKV